MGHQHEAGSGTLSTLVAGAVIGAAGLAWWLLNEADRRRVGQQRAMLHAPRMQDGSEVLEQGENCLLEQRVERLNAEIARVRAQLERLGSED